MTTFARELSADTEKHNIFSWDVVDGIKMRQFEKGVLRQSTPESLVDQGFEDPFIALTWAGSLEEESGMPNSSILFLQDFHHSTKKPEIVRKIRNILPLFKATGKVLVIVSHTMDLPPDLEKEITPIKFKLPCKEELKITLKSVCEAAMEFAGKDLYPKDDNHILEAALGMTAMEAENAFALSLREKQCFDVKLINREKASIVRKTGLLEVVETENTLADVGGQESLKDWLKAREDCFSEKAREYGVRPPKGLLLGGPPGTGKSLMAKCTASLLNRPLLRLDVGKIFGSLVGDSEKNIRKVLDIADAVAPCVLWIDELEKSFKKDNDGGSNEVSMRVYSTFLTWLQEKTSDVFIVATANDVEKIDSALLRRLDVIFWVDLPDEKQRKEILSIHIKKTGRDPKNFDIDKLAKVSAKFSGSEIETWVRDEALTYGYQAGHAFCDQDLLDVVKDVIPQAVLMAEDIARYRKWADEHQVRQASKKAKKVEIPIPAKRKMSLGPTAGMAN